MNHSVQSIYNIHYTYLGVLKSFTAPKGDDRRTKKIKNTSLLYLEYTIIAIIIKLIV